MIGTSANQLTDDNMNTALMTLVFLNSTSLPDAAVIENALREVLPDLPTQTSAEMKSAAALLIPYEGMLITIMGIAAPAPMAASDPQFTNAWYWPKAWAELSTHRSHIIVSVSGGAEDAVRALMLARVLAALLTVVEAPLGICNTTSGTLLPMGMVSTLLKQQASVAVALFLSCHFAQEAEGTFPKQSILASTKGLSDFGLMEIEARGFTGRVPELYQFIVWFAAYLITDRPTIRDGHTIGRNADERVKIRIEKSMYYGAKVYCLYFQ